MPPAQRSLAMTCLFLMSSLAASASTALEGLQAPPSLAEIQERFAMAGKRLHDMTVRFEVDHSIHVSIPEAKTKDGYIMYSRILVDSAFKGSKRYYDETYKPKYGDEAPPNFPIRRAMSYDDVLTRILTGLNRPTAKEPNWARIWSTNQMKQFSFVDDYMAYQGHPRATEDLYLDGKDFHFHDIAGTLAKGGYRVEAERKPSSDGVSCVIVSSERDRMWLDPAIGLALRQRDWIVDPATHRRVRTRLSGHVEAAPGFWIPRAIDADYTRTSAGADAEDQKPYRTKTIRLTEFTIDSTPETMFTLAIPPGTLVEDVSRLQPLENGDLPVVTYLIPTQPGNLEEIIDRATQERAGSESRMPANPSRSNLLWVLAANGLLAIIVGVVLFLQRRAHAQPPKTTSQSTIEHNQFFQ